MSKTVIRKEKGVPLEMEDLIDTHIALNQIVNNLYNTIDNKDKIINEQALEIARLKEKIYDYEEPDDMTLMFMWCDEKAKDKIKDLQQKIELLQNDLDNANSKLSDLMKSHLKAIEYIKSYNSTIKSRNELGIYVDFMSIPKELSEILGDKENE